MQREWNISPRAPWSHVVRRREVPKSRSSGDTLRCRQVPRAALRAAQDSPKTALDRPARAPPPPREGSKAAPGPVETIPKQFRQAPFWGSPQNHRARNSPEATAAPSRSP